MKNLRNLIGILLLVLIASSCSKKVAFTSTIQKQHNFSESALKQVQFYTSDKIILYQASSEGDMKVDINGKLLLTNNNESEKVIINKNTPCVLEKKINDNLFVFSFEYGDDKLLAFGNGDGGFYSLMANDWNNKKGDLTYANRSYSTYSGGVYLTVKMKKLTKIQNRERTVKGRKIR